MARGPNWDATAISESACYFTTNPSAPSGYDILRQLVSDFFPDLIITVRPSASLTWIWSSSSSSVCPSCISPSRPHASRQATQSPRLRCHALPHCGQSSGSLCGVIET